MTSGRFTNMSSVVPLLILVVWLFFAGKTLLSARKETGVNRLVSIVAPIFLTIGALGFLGAGLFACGGGKWLPNSFEWPVGAADGVATTGDHYFIVPHTPVGRVQVYDCNWKFVRGWQVDANGGYFNLFVSDTNHVHVITARGRWHYAFDLAGKLLSKEQYPLAAKNSFPVETASYNVPTAPWLWVFTSPVYCWLAAMIGMVMLVFKDRIHRKAKTTNERG
jgi:hypothetical protein